MGTLAGMGQSRVQQLGERITESEFVRNVIGPKVLEPVTVWYEQNLRDGDDEPHDDIDRSPDATGSSGDAGVIDVTHQPQDSTPNGVSATNGSDPAASPGLESARAAERFLEGDGQDPPASPGGRAVVAPGPAASTLVATSDLDATTEMPAAPTVPDSRPDVGGWRGARDIAMRVKDRVKHHNLNVVAAGIAFWSLLAIPAVLTSIISIYGLVADPDEVEDQINNLLSGISARSPDRRRRTAEEHHQQRPGWPAHRRDLRHRARAVERVGCGRETHHHDEHHLGGP